MTGAVFVPGWPQPQGSLRAFVVHGKGGAAPPRAIVTHDNPGTMPWRASVAALVRSQVGAGIDLPTQPVVVALSFVMPRRKAEPKRVTPGHTRKPDLDRLIRACLDAMTGLVYTDDAQVVELAATKRTAGIGEQPGVMLEWWAA
jgi:crossover junction endodeoxyribonuclease RusA